MTARPGSAESGAEGYPSRGSADSASAPAPSALAALEAAAAETVFAENRAAAARCRAVHAIHVHHEAVGQEHLAAVGPDEADWKLLEPFDNTCRSVIATNGVTWSRANDMVLLAADVHEWAPDVLAAMESGLMCERIALLICNRIRDFSTDLRTEIQAAVVADYLNRLRGGERPNQQSIKRRCDRLARRIDPEGARRRREEAAYTRSVRIRAEEDGMCTLTARLTAEAGALLAERIDAFAGSAGPGDRRSLAERRADALTAMALGGHALFSPDGTAAPAPAPAPAQPTSQPTTESTAEPSPDSDGEPSPSGPTESQAPTPDPATEPSGPVRRGDHSSRGGQNPGGDSECGCAASRNGGASRDGGAPRGGTEPRGGTASPVSVSPVLRPRITIIATGTGAPTVEFARTGETTMAALERLLAKARGATFELIDSRPGTSDRPENELKYRIPSDLARRVRLRDGTCRHPGCAVPADRCDVDHVVPFDHSDPSSGGLTIEANLVCLCRRHHRYKTFSGARFELHPGGDLEIRIGRHVLTTRPGGALGRARKYEPPTVPAGPGPRGRTRPAAGTPRPPVPDDDPPPF